MKKIITEPLVSVVVRTCNRPFLLKRALKSIFDQKYPALEIVVVDDGEYKINPSVLNSGTKHCKIKYVKTSQRGRSFAANSGIDAADGDFIIFLDDDDELYPEHAQILMDSLLKGNPIVYSDCELSFETYDVKSDSLSIDKQYVRFSTKFNQGLLFVRNYIPLMCLCFSKALLKEVGGFDEDIDLYEDWDLLLRLSFKNNFHHVPQVTAKYRFWSKDQITAATDSKDKADYYKLVSRYMERLTPHNLYEIFLFSEDKYTLMTELNDCRQQLRERESENLELNRIKSSQEETIDQLQGANVSLETTNSALETTNTTLETTNIELAAAENKVEQLINDTRKISIEKEELVAINELYVVENIKKEEYIAKLESDLAKKTKKTADTKSSKHKGNP